MSHDENLVAEDSEDDFDWEEVAVPQQPPLDISLDQDEPQAVPSDLTRPNIEITIQARPKPNEEAK